MKVILITGTPATGKSHLAQKLAKLTNSGVLDLNSLIKKEKLHDGYDRSRRCYIVDTKKLSLYIGKYIENCSDNILLIDGLLSHYYKPADLCIVTKCNLKTLKRRLVKKSGDGRSIIVDGDGVKKRVKDEGGSIPEYLDWPVKTREDWEKYKAERLNPKTQGRYPDNLDNLVLLCIL